VDGIIPPNKMAVINRLSAIFGFLLRVVGEWFVEQQPQSEPLNANLHISISSLRWALELRPSVKEISPCDFSNV
jgi:hypothetical protein